WIQVFEPAHLFGVSAAVWRDAATGRTRGATVAPAGRGGPRRGTMGAGCTGRRVPDVTLCTRPDGQWGDVPSPEAFAGQRVVLFAVPGGFTPTCSSAHLPRYDALYEEFRKAGIDDVLCLSVNDAFAMDAWGATSAWSTCACCRTETPSSAVRWAC